MADELIDIYNQNNKSLGLRKMKSEAHRDGLWHRASHVWIYNGKGEILLQLRAKGKDLYPDMWDVSAAGHIGAGEEPIVAAVRETGEEIGLSINSEDLDFLWVQKVNIVYDKMKNNEFQYVYLYKFCGDIEDLVLQKEEVADIRFVSIGEIKDELEINSEKYVSRGNYWFEVMEEVGRRLSSN